MLKYSLVNKGKVQILAPRDDFEKNLKDKGYRIVKREVKEGGEVFLTFRKGRSVITTFDGKETVK